MLATVHSRIFCLSVCCPKILRLKNTVKILPVVLYECETWSLALREERRLRVQSKERIFRQCTQILLLGTFEKLRKASISFVMSVCPSVRPSVFPYGTTRLSLEGF